MTAIAVVFLFSVFCPLLAVTTRQRTAAVPQKELHIGGVFPMEAGTGGWPGGQACLPAVKMALEDVNGDINVLPNYALRLHYHNSKCQPGLATKQLFELLYKPPVKLMLLSGCSPVTTIVAESAPVWNLIVISYGASSPALSNRARFPTLFRTHPSANMQNPTRLHLFEKFKWKRFTILQSVEEVFTSTAKDLEEQARQRGMRVDRQSFYGDPTDAVKTLVRQDARVIVGLFYVTEARRVLCQAYQHGLYGRRYVWFMIGWYADTWFIPPSNEGINCTAEQMKKAAEYHFTTESIMLSKDEMPAISGMTGRQFQNRLNSIIKTDPANTGGYPEAPLAYDAVWALALALNCTQNALPYGIHLEDFTYNNAVIADKMFACVKNTQFKGVSGQVMFSDSGDRIARTQIEQLQDGKYTIVGFYDTTSQTLEWLGNEKFPTNRGPPPDSTIIRHQQITLSFRLYITVVFFVCVGLIMAASMYVFNKKFAYRRIIIQSLPQCNNILILGCSLSLLGVLLMGVPAGDVLAFPEHVFAPVCHTRVTLLMLGFMLAYGALFTKVWIVHRRGTSENHEIAAARRKDEEETSPWESIRTLLVAMVGRQTLVTNALRKISSTTYANTNVGSKATKRSYFLNQPIPIARVYTVVTCLLLVDLLIIFAWIVFDPFQRHEKTFILQEPPAGNDEDVMLLPILEQCESNARQIWTIVVFGYKGLLILFGVFLAFETRHLKLRYVNDLRLVLLAICNVSVLCVMCGPIVIFFLRAHTDAFFGFVAATVILCVYISLGLIFFPKIIYIYKTPYTRDESGKSVVATNSGGRRTPNVMSEKKVAGSSGRSQTRTVSGTIKSLSRQLSINSTKSEQLRYHQLQKENAELKHQIEIRKTKIAECMRLLERKLLERATQLNGVGATISLDRRDVLSMSLSGGQPTDEGIASLSLPSTSYNAGGRDLSTVSSEEGLAVRIGTKLAIERDNSTTDIGICADFKNSTNSNKNAVERIKLPPESSSISSNASEVLL